MPAAPEPLADAAARSPAEPDLGASPPAAPPAVYAAPAEPVCVDRPVIALSSYIQTQHTNAGPKSAYRERVVRNQHQMSLF